MTEDHISGLPETLRLPHEAHVHTITPYFKIMTPLNVAQSEEAGKPVYDAPREMVELRFAGDRNYAPVLPADSMFRKVGNRVITYAERFADQYRAFMVGDDQRAGGTALEMLADYGITPAQLSVCRALKIYSIEALYELDGHNAKALGMNSNALKAMARRYMEDHNKRALSSTEDKMAALEAEIARLRAAIPAAETSPDDIHALVAAADAEASTANDRFEAMSDGELKLFIKEKSGAAPRGTPSRDFLLNAARELAA